MGDRVSISFSNGGDESVALFSHCGGMSFVEMANEYVRVLKAEKRDRHFAPLDRLEPETVMVDFIRFITEGEKRIDSNYYLGADSEEGDNSDNGHFVIDLAQEAIKHPGGYDFQFLRNEKKNRVI